MNDLSILFKAQDKVERWIAERENASARLELARIDENCARLISQHEPLATLGIDREVLKLILRYVKNGNVSGLMRDFEESKK